MANIKDKHKKFTDTVNVEIDSKFEQYDKEFKSMTRWNWVSLVALAVWCGMTVTAIISSNSWVTLLMFITVMAYYIVALQYERAKSKFSRTSGWIDGVLFYAKEIKRAVEGMDPPTKVPVKSETPADLKVEVKKKADAPAN
jgi:hypothetical protein